VIGTHGRTGVERVIFGSTAEKVVRMATCPVLSVREGGKEFVHP
jgi:nucleotide-binding universal stress UspA family protein